MRSLCFRGPVYGSSGYSVAARNFLLALDKKQKLEIQLQATQWLSGFDPHLSKEDYLRLRALEKKQVSPQSSLLLHWSTADEFKGREGYRFALGHSVFETDRLPKSMVVGCNRMDAIMVPTSFNQESFSRSGVEVPIYIIPEGVDSQRFSPEGDRLKEIPQRFTFLFIAQFSYRKGIDLLLRAFLELFAEHQDVQLILRSHITDGSPQDLKQIAQFVAHFRRTEMRGLKGGHLYLLNNLTESDLPALYRSSHVLLSPFRGEGWGLTLTEALSAELPVIATHWGGPQAFLDTDSATLLSHKLLPIPEAVPAHFLGQHLMTARREGHLLAECNLEELKYHMWHSYQDYFSYKARALHGRKKMLQQFQWSHAAEQFIQLMERLE